MKTFKKSDVIEVATQKDNCMYRVLYKTNNTNYMVIGLIDTVTDRNIEKAIIRHVYSALKYDYEVSDTLLHLLRLIKD